MRLAVSPLVNALLWIALVALLVLSPAVGSLSSVVAVLALVCLAPAALRQGGWTRLTREPAMLVFLAVFLVLAAVFAATANDLRDPAYALNFLALPAAGLLFVLLSRAPGPRAGDAILVLCLLGAVASAVIALIDVHILGSARAHGFVGGGPNLFPRVAIPLGFAALAGVFRFSGRMRLLLYLGPLAALVATYYSGSRGAAVALPPLVLLLALQAETRRHAIVIGALGIAVIAGLLFGGSDLAGRFAGTAETIGELLTSGQSSDSATAERMVALVAAWPAFLTSPLIGVGWGNMGAVAMAVAPDIGWSGEGEFFFHADLPNFAVAAGTVGVLCWLALLAAPVLGALATPRDGLFRARLYLGAMLGVSYFVFGLTDLTLGYDLPTTLYAFMTAIALATLREDRPPAA